MSREDPTPEEEAFIDVRAGYERDCIAWRPAGGAPYPHPPRLPYLTFRPMTLFDDGDAYMQAYSNYNLACAEAINRRDKLPLKPLRLPGRPRKNRLPGKRPGARRIYALRESVGLTSALVAAVDAFRSPDESRGRAIQRALEGLWLPAPANPDKEE